MPIFSDAEAVLYPGEIKKQYVDRLAALEVAKAVHEEAKARRM